MSFMSNARTWLMDTLQTADGYSATYTRSSASVSLTAWLGQTRFLSVVQGSGRLEFGELDVLIRADELILSGSRVDPARGDAIALTLNGTAITVEVMPPNSDEPPWRWSDPQRELLRIHCKRIS